tara:strand:+ start:108 stop:608 length:501 start_codon:yes stop_codon:yes gene_type:complete
MLFISLIPTERAERYLKRDNIDLRILQTTLNFYALYIDKRKKIENIKMSLDIDCRKADSEYNFVSKHILIAGIGQNDKKIKTKKGRLRYLLEHLAHEFRHCMQEVIFKRDASEVTYESTDDASYADNPLEIDAMWFEERVNKKFVDLYYHLNRNKTRKDISKFFTG